MDFLQKHNVGIKVKPRSKEAIIGSANAFRKKVCKTKVDECLDILKVLEMTLPNLTSGEFEFYPLEEKAMGDTEAAMSQIR